MKEIDLKAFVKSIHRTMPGVTAMQIENESIDITDKSDDFPFCSLWFNPKNGGNCWDVCATRTSLEYGNEIRDDAYAAKQCTFRAALALARWLRSELYPTDPRGFSKSYCETIFD